MQSNPLARWHICQGSINSIAFSTDGAYLATVGRDGIICSIPTAVYCGSHCLFCTFFFFFCSKEKTTKQNNKPNDKQHF